MFSYTVHQLHLHLTQAKSDFLKSICTILFSFLFFAVMKSLNTLISSGHELNCMASAQPRVLQQQLSRRPVAQICLPSAGLRKNLSLIEDVKLATSLQAKTQCKENRKHKNNS